MPYVQSIDRTGLDILIDGAAHTAASKSTDNTKLLQGYKQAFTTVASNLLHFVRGGSGCEVKQSPYMILARGIYEAGEQYGYDGAYLGELNYAITRFIQKVPQIKVESGEWEPANELRYWLYARTVEALIWASAETLSYGCGIAGVFEDIKDEYKRRVSAPYEITQQLKNGDCYTTPYYTKPIPLYNQQGHIIGYMEVHMTRDATSLDKDSLPDFLMTQGIVDQNHKD
ncbi:MAG: hypothetical protein O2794_01850 [bacterium]|nr:hypothetical protein [bacterium]